MQRHTVLRGMMVLVTACLVAFISPPPADSRGELAEEERQFFLHRLLDSRPPSRLRLQVDSTQISRGEDPTSAASRLLDELEEATAESLQGLIASMRPGDLWAAADPGATFSLPQVQIVARGGLELMKSASSKAGEERTFLKSRGQFLLVRSGLRGSSGEKTIQLTVTSPNRVALFTPEFITAPVPSSPDVEDEHGVFRWSRLESTGQVNDESESIAIQPEEDPSWTIVVVFGASLRPVAAARFVDAFGLLQMTIFEYRSPDQDELAIVHQLRRGRDSVSLRRFTIEPLTTQIPLSLAVPPTFVLVDERVGRSPSSRMVELADVPPEVRPLLRLAE